MVDIKVREKNKEIFKYGHTNGMEQVRCSEAYREQAVQQRFSPVTIA